jgi:isopentenyldiphosphate isomerase
MKESWYEPGQFDDLLVEEFDPAVIPEGAEKLYFVHGDDDPFCDYDLAREFCKQVGGTFVSVPGGGHIGVDADIAELPLLRNVLVIDGVLSGKVEGGTHEPIVWVDEENNVLGPIERGYAKKSGERYRMTRVIIEDERGNTLIQKRTMTKDSYPGCWDNSTAGHVTWGESYEDAVRREIGEELGLLNAEPKQLFSYYSEVVDPIGAVLNEWGMVYHVKIAHDTEFAMQEEELSGLRWVTPEELGEIVAEGEVTEGLRQIYQRYFEKKAGEHVSISTKEEV